MSSYDLIVRNGTLVLPQALYRADIAVDEGRICAIAPDLGGAATHTIEARGQVVFPGGIDAHVHVNDPGRAAWEGFASGTRALAAGGMTTFIDMPLNAHPPTIDGASFSAKVAAAQGQALVDFALWGGLVPGNRDHLDGLAACGVVGFKAFMSQSGIDDFAAVDDLTLYEGMVRARALGLPVAVHAESDVLTARLSAQAIAEGRLSARDYLASRPVVAELEAISRALLFAAETGCALHIVHVSTGRGVALVAEARARGLDVSCETCPHYLTLTEEDLERLGPVAKCAPPLRSAAESAALWSALHDGTLPMVASDHSPAPFDLKDDPNMFAVWGGISGCQSTLPLLLTEGHARRHLPLPAIASAVSGYVARRFRLPGKGHLQVGADADLVLIDLDAEVTLQAAELFYRHQHSPYVGRTMRGRITQTLLRGQPVYRDGQIVSPPIGRLLTPRAVDEGPQ